MSRPIDVVGLTILIAATYATTRGIWNMREAGLDGTVDVLLVGISVGLILGLVLAGLFCAIAYRLTARFEVYISARFQSVRDIVPYAISSERIAWTREGVSTAIKEIAVEQMGLDQRDYTEDSRFVEDFGVN